MESKNIYSKPVTNDSIKTLKELCLLHSDDPTLHTRLAECLFDEGREIAALVTARKAYQVLIRENPAEAAILVDRFGVEVSIDDKRPPVSKSYLPLADFFGKFRFNRHKLRLSEGDVLYYKGEPADSIYLILEGEVTVNAEVDGVHSIINYLHVGSLVGRHVQEANAIHEATVVAMKDTVFLRFTQEELEKTFAKHPELEIQFSKEIMLRRRVEMLSSSKLFARMPMGMRFLIASRSWGKVYQVGELVKAPNQHMNHAELIVSGVVHLYDEHQGEIPIYCGRMSVGELMGLYKLMHQQALSLVIKAETKCEVLCINFADIEDLMDIQPAIRQKLLDASVDFSQQITRTILLQKRRNTPS